MARSAVRGLLEVGRDVDHEVGRVHVAEQAHEAALVELHELLGQAHLVQVAVAQVAADEHVARDARDVLLDQRVAVVQEGDHVGRKHVLELEPVQARGIGALHVEVVEVVVERVDDAHAKRLRIAVGTQVHAVDDRCSKASISPPVFMWA